MNYDLLFHPLSEEEYVAAYLWYEEQKATLGKRFEDEVSILLAKIASRPLDYGYSSKPYREARVEGFPFTIVYKINKLKRQILISAIYHTARNPGKKRR